MPIDPREQSGAQRFFGTLLGGFADIARDVPGQIRQAKEAERQRKRQDLQDVFNSERLRIAQEGLEIRKNSLRVASEAMTQRQSEAVSTLSGLFGGGEGGIPFAPSFGEQSIGALEGQIATIRTAPQRARDVRLEELKILEKQEIIKRIGRANRPKVGSPKGEITAADIRKKTLVDEEVERRVNAFGGERNSLLDKLEAGLRAKNASFKPKDIHQEGKFKGFVKFVALRREALKFDDPEGDRPGSLFEEDVDKSFLEIVNKIDSLDIQIGAINRKDISDRLSTIFPSLGTDFTEGVGEIGTSEEEEIKRLEAREKELLNEQRQ